MPKKEERWIKVYLRVNVEFTEEGSPAERGTECKPQNGIKQKRRIPNSIQLSVSA